MHHHNVVVSMLACLYSATALSHMPSLQHPTQEKPINFQQLLTIKPDDKSNVMNTGGAFTITGNGTIRFLQAFFYTNSNCTGLLGSASVIDNVTGITFTSGQTIDVNAASVFMLANNQGISVGNIACMTLYVNGSHQSSNGVSCQSFTDMNCNNGHCTSNQTNTVSWTSNPSACATQYAYIGNFISGASTISQCTVNPTTGVLSNCNASSDVFGDADGIALNNNYIYVADNGNGTSNSGSILQCNIDAATGTFNNCTTTIYNLGTPAGITLNNGYVYFTEYDNGAIWKCTVSPSTGYFSDCGVTGDDMNFPNSITINKGFAYIVNSGNSSIAKCTVNSTTGELTTSSCVTVLSGLSDPKTIAINNGYAYITNYDSAIGTTVMICELTVAGGLTNCAAATPTFSTPYGITLNNDYAYITNKNTATVSQCSTGSDGTLSNCTTLTGFTSPLGISIF